MQIILHSHLLSLLLDEEHQLQPEEGDGLVVGALTGELLVEWRVVAGLSLDHLDPGHPGEPGHGGEPGDEEGW